MDERMKNMTKEKDVGGNKDDNYINLMIHGNEELEHLTEYSQVSEIKLDKEWTYEIHKQPYFCGRTGQTRAETKSLDATRQINEPFYKYKHKYIP